MTDWTTATRRSLPKVSAVLITREESYPADVRLNFPFDEVLIQPRCQNVFRRYQMATNANNNCIYFQDDDTVIDIMDLWSNHDGESLTHAMTPGHRSIYAGTGVTLIGWGSFFPKQMVLEFLEREPFWRRVFGDEVFEAEADRMFTFQHRDRCHDVLMPIRQFRRSVRMSDRPGHYATRDSIIKTLNGMA